MDSEEGHEKRAASSVWRKVAFVLGLYGLGFLISYAMMGLRFQAQDAVLGTVIMGTVVLLPFLLIRLAKRVKEGVAYDGSETTPPSTFAALLVIGPIIAIMVALALVWSTHNLQRRCDRAAEADLKKLSGAVERLGNELTGLGCPDLSKEFSEEQVRYLVGPYYGWRGTTGRCRVLVSMEGGEIRSCALRGSRPSDNRQHRRIFRASLFGKRTPDPAVGVCQGKQYGFFPDHLHFRSMVVNKDGRCTFHEPPELEGVKPDGYEEYHRELRKQRQQ